MSILTKSMIELQEEKAAERKYLAANRPNSQSRKLKWRLIEDIKDRQQMVKLESNTIEIG